MPLYKNLPGESPDTATSLQGGEPGALPFQVAPNTTDFLAPGNTGQVLVMIDGSPAWDSRSISFSARAGSNTFLSAGVPSVVELSSEEFNIGNGYNSSESKFQPDIAGYYFISSGLLGSIAVGEDFSHTINRNGIAQRNGIANLSLTDNTTVYSQASGIYYLDGNTDYIQISCSSTAEAIVVANFDSTWIEGFLIFPVFPG